MSDETDNLMETDQVIADEIKRRVEALNAAIEIAYKNKLCVKVEVIEHYNTRRVAPFVVAETSKPL
jgi:hypothetical protein